ncbi:MAG: phenylalanine--tRNA ligase subunit beta [Candidatus Moraniibacteriota bacterium]|nr:MAG: phenylalanine--tRNA ligase subunit beta [Candidatus Moranbacteria bacterium]
MKYSVSWLNELAMTNITVEQMAELFTRHSFEVESIEKNPGMHEGVIVGKILEISSHPNADTLQLTKVALDQQEKTILSIVCGAHNISIGDSVPVATIGTELPHGLCIKKSKIRGIESEGMLCAEDELGLGEDHSGIFLLDKTIPLGTKLCDIFEKGDDSIELDILASRGHDALSHIGVARELSCILKTTLRFDNEKYELPSISEKNISVEIENKERCNRYIGALLYEIKNDTPTPSWMQSRLSICGIKSINIATDITNYVMLETGQPLHAFDAKISGSSLFVRNAKEGESLELLDGSKKELSQNDIVIANKTEILALAGIMGGKNSATDENTTSVFLEGAWFHPVSIRKSRIFHKLDTESSYRFERDIDPNGASIAVSRALELFKEYAGAKIMGVCDKYPQVSLSKTVELQIAQVERLLGIKKEKEEIRKILLSLGFSLEEKTKEIFLVHIPTRRRDISHEEDLIEEIGRIYGYEKIDAVAPKVSLQIGERNTSLKLKRHIEDICISMGYDEIKTYSFYSQKTAKTFLLPEENHFSLANPMSPDQELFRSDILVNMMRSLRENIRRFDTLSLFEAGKVYTKKSDSSVCEIFQFGMISSTTKKEENARRFFVLKGDIQALSQKLFFSETEFESLKKNEGGSYFHPSQSAKVQIFGKTIGYVGMIHPYLAKLWKIPVSTSLARFDFDSIFKCRENVQEKYSPLDKFPGVMRDISLLVTSPKITAKIIQETIQKSAKKLLRSLELFDLYESKEGKSMAYHLVFGSVDRTLSGKEVDAVREILFEDLEKLSGVKVKK